MHAAERLRALHAAIALLRVRIETIGVKIGHAKLASYPGGARPTSSVVLAGSNVTGTGEHVGWTGAAHREFACAAPAVSRGTFVLGEWIRGLRDLPAYDRAALEAAAIDLALRQQRTSVFELAAVRPEPVRYVVSFAVSADPAGEAGRVLPREVGLKIDATPEWDDDVYEALAGTGRVAVVDFKGGGTREDHERACRHLPDCWIEDPALSPGWSNALASRYSADASVTTAAGVAALEPAPRAVNVKPARMGGVLEAIDCLARCAEAGIENYVGGMFEAGVARRQLAALAALACPEAPNDIAPLDCEPHERPARIVVDANAAGFGA